MSVSIVPVLCVFVSKVTGVSIVFECLLALCPFCVCLLARAQVCQLCLCVRSKGPGDKRQGTGMNTFAYIQNEWHEVMSRYACIKSEVVSRSAYNKNEVVSRSAYIKNEVPRSAYIEMRSCQDLHTLK